MPQFSVTLSPRANKQLSALPPKTRQQYAKAFRAIARQGPAYPSLRTHRYRTSSGQIWGSSASMSLRFYWDYCAHRTILVAGLDAH